MSNKIKKYKTPLVTILLGALGSALWSFITAINNYFSNIVASYFISISTYFDKRIFTQVAQNDMFFLQQSISSTGSLVLCLVAAIFAMGFPILIIFIEGSFNKEYLELKRLGHKYDLVKDLEEKIEYTDEEVATRYYDLVESYQRTKNNLKLMKQIFKFLSPILFISLMISFSVNTLTNRYIADSIQYFNYLLKVNAAYIDTNLEREYLSKFSQIRNGEDYRKIVLELEKLALEHRLHFKTNLNIRSEEDIIKDHPKVVFEE